jgi:hypothetical protein
MEVKLWIDAGGWLGAAALLLAYCLVSTGKLGGTSLSYQWLNLAGGALLLANSFYYGALPSVGVNAVWIAIGIFTLARRRVKTHSGQSQQPH